MKESAVQINQRKIRNGIRKQREAIEREKQKIWDKLKDTNPASSSKWTHEAKEDLQIMHGLDVEQVLTDILIAEIAAGKCK